MSDTDTPTSEEIETLRAALQIAAADGNWCGQAAHAIATLQRELEAAGSERDTCIPQVRDLWPESQIASAVSERDAVLESAPNAAAVVVVPKEVCDFFLRWHSPGEMPPEPRLSQMLQRLQEAAAGSGGQHNKLSDSHESPAAGHCQPAAPAKELIVHAWLKEQG